MRWSNCILFAVLLAFSCQKSARKPDDILSQEDMVKVLSELYIAEEKVTRLTLQQDSAQQVFELFRDKVFEITGVPDSVFKKSFNYYMDHPIEMETIYAVLVDSLQLREQRAPYRPDQR